MIIDSLELFISVLAISILHAILPNHWLPVVAISRQLNWDGRKTAGVTMLAALAHSLSTVIIGILVALGGMTLNGILPYFKYIAAGMLISLGILFIWRHQHHMHFHLKDIKLTPTTNMRVIIGTLLIAMFLSPCLEVGALFLVAGTKGIALTLIIAGIYTITSAIGMTLFAWLALHGLKKMDWHKLEHNSGLVSGIILVLTGIIFIFSH
jgi:nickel/cobalt transporter (NicO) family protein